MWCLTALVVAAATPATPIYPDKQHLLSLADDQGQLQPITAADAWRRRREHILAAMQQVMGPLPGAEKRVPLDVQVSEEADLGEVVRRKLTYAAEPGDRVPAYLFLPNGAAGKRPAVLCLHQTTGIGKGEPAGLGGLPNLHYALELARRGYVTLAPDYPRFGDYAPDQPDRPYQLGYASATMKGIWNHLRAVDLLQALPAVDSERIGCLGHSLGGHNTLFLAAFDERIKVAVTSCGFTAFPRYYGGDLTGWSHLGYMPRIAQVYGKDPQRMPFDFSEVLAAIAPRTVFVNAPLRDANFDPVGVDEAVAAARPVFELLDAGPRLTVLHPDCEHDFPPAARREAYAAIDRALGFTP